MPVAKVHRISAAAPDDVRSSEVGAAVHAALADGGIDTPADVHVVQVKCPLLTAQRVGDAEERGAAVMTRDTLKSMGLSRAASALGVAVALGELALSGLDDE